MAYMPGGAAGIMHGHVQPVGGGYGSHNRVPEQDSQSVIVTWDSTISGVTTSTANSTTMHARVTMPKELGNTTMKHQQRETEQTGMSNQLLMP